MKAAKILVVDDEPFALAILERLLKMAGYSVHLTKNGAEALKIFPKFNPDLVLLDLMMPGMNGEEVCRQIRKTGLNPKIVYFSAKQYPSNNAAFGEPDCQPDAFISKPASSKIILSTIQNILSGKNLKAG